MSRDDAGEAFGRQESQRARTEQAAALKRRLAVGGALADPTKAWGILLDDADAGRDMTSSLLLVVAAELREIRRILEERRP